jgi:hypothetical protein
MYRPLVDRQVVCITNGGGNLDVYNVEIHTKILRGLSPLKNYTNRATTACRRSYWQLLRIEVATWSA